MVLLQSKARLHSFRSQGKRRNMNKQVPLGGKECSSSRHEGGFQSKKLSMWGKGVSRGGNNYQYCKGAITTDCKGLEVSCDCVRETFREACRGSRGGLVQNLLFSGGIATLEVPLQCHHAPFREQ